MWHSKLCSHSFCAGCVNSNFSNRQTLTKCPQPCGVSLTRANLDERTNEEREFEREKEVRARLLFDYNLKRGDFADPEEWAKYCETVETLVAALVVGSEGEKREAERMVQDYRRTHLDSINRAAARYSAEDETRLKVEQREARAMCEEAAVKAEEAKARARVAAEVQKFKHSVAMGEADFGGAASVGGLVALRDKLLAEKATREAEAAALRAIRPPPPPPPCPNIPLPKVYGLKNKSWVRLKPHMLPRDSLRGHWRATGFSASQCSVWALEDLRDILGDNFISSRK